MRKSANGRVHRSLAEWQRIIEQWSQSGLEPAAFCEREGIVWRSFQKWSRRVQGAPEKARTGTGTRWGPCVELLPGLPGASHGEVEIALPNGVVVRVRG